MKKFLLLLFVCLMCASALGIAACSDSGGKVLVSPIDGESTGSITFTPSATLGSFVGDSIQWKDSQGKNRSAFLVNPTTSLDPSGAAYGGYMRQFTYQKSDGTVRTVGPGHSDVGFGMVWVQKSSDFSNYGSKWTSGGTRTLKSQGQEHVVIQYSWPHLTESGSSTNVSIAATVIWQFISGQDYPVISVTHDTSAYANNAFNGQPISPYGDMEFADGSNLTSLGWGDHEKFTTTSTPLSYNSTWTYNTATNTIPYVVEASSTANAEGGLVQNTKYAVHDLGQGPMYSEIGKTSSTKTTTYFMPTSQKMPDDYAFVMMADQYFLDSGDLLSKPLGMLMNYGAVGSNTADIYDSTTTTVTGYPYQSYSTSLIFGAQGVTAARVTDLEALVAGTYTASVGTIVSSEVVAPGRTDSISFSSPTGYNYFNSSVDVTANGSSNATLTLALGTKTTHNPLIRVLSYTNGSLPTVKDGSTILVNGTGYFASVDTTNHVLWLVMNEAMTGSHTITITTSSGSDAGTDSGTDSGVDSGVDSGTDSGTDAGLDSGTDSGTAWTGISEASNQNVSGNTSTVYSWQDSNNNTRTMSLVNNNAVDPSGFYGGYIVQATYKAGGTNYTAVPRPSGIQSPIQPGLGYTLHHNGLSDTDGHTMSSRHAPGTFQTVFLGRHHSLFEYSWPTLVSQDGTITYNVITTVGYLFSTGRSAPLWIHTIDMSGVAVNTIQLDDRSPSGEINFDGAESAVQNLGWGDDTYKFKTTSSPVSFNSTWDYTQLNNGIPYHYITAGGVEESYTQSNSIKDTDSCYGWIAFEHGLTSADKVVNSSNGAPATPNMFDDWQWVYQSIQYGLESGDLDSKRFDLGLEYGLGQSTYQRFDDAVNVSGYPYRRGSYYVSMDAIGTVANNVTQVENISASTITASVGTVQTTAPYGIGGASGTTSTLYVPGYEPNFGTYLVAASANSAHMSVVIPTGKSLTNPMFRITSYTAGVPSVVLNGTTLTADVDYFASEVTNLGASELWLTLNKIITGTNALNVN